MNSQNTLFAACIAGFFGVALGAFGAHGLKDALPPALLTVYQTGVHYHLIHALVLFGIGIWQYQRPTPWLNRASILMLMGICLFSGSLYLMAITGIRQLGMVTPLGGVAWLIGWGILARTARAGGSSPG